MNVCTELSGIDAARAFFREEKLMMPPIPDVFEERLEVIAPGCFGVGCVEGKPLHDLGAFVERAMGDSDSSFFAFGHAGHGVNSWALHYYWVDGPLALFVQLPYGGAYMDRAASVINIVGAWSLISDIIIAEKQADVAPEERLYIIESAMGARRWAWTKRGKLVPHDAWSTQDPVLFNALCSLKAHASTHLK